MKACASKPRFTLLCLPSSLFQVQAPHFHSSLCFPLHWWRHHQTPCRTPGLFPFFNYENSLLLSFLEGVPECFFQDYEFLLCIKSFWFLQVHLDLKWWWRWWEIVNGCEALMSCIVKACLLKCGWNFLPIIFFREWENHWITVLCLGGSYSCHDRITVSAVTKENHNINGNSSKIQILLW